MIQVSNPPEALSQSEIVLSLRPICFTHHLQKWESYLTEIKQDMISVLRMSIVPVC